MSEPHERRKTEEFDVKSKTVSAGFPVLQKISGG